jgi:hypothetical protein
VPETSVDEDGNSSEIEYEIGTSFDLPVMEQPTSHTRANKPEALGKLGRPIAGRSDSRHRTRSNVGCHAVHGKHFATAAEVSG